MAGLAWIAASAYARMANLAVEAELELGRRERLGRALLDALTDPTSVLDAQGRIVAANQAWVRFAAKDLAGLPWPRSAGATRPPAGGRGRRPRRPGRPPEGSGVLGGEVSLFRCRYQAPGGAGPCEVTVTPFADGDGAVVTHRPTAAANPTPAEWGP